jgi:uncharacterized protein YdhG (YjbR/CyaY superfamily)
MQREASSADDYIAQCPEDRHEALQKLRKAILSSLPIGFEEGIGYGMVGYVVPHSIYPAGYHCDPKQPLPFAGFASQKNFISFYHMGIYGMPELMDWFLEEYKKVVTGKIDMGKSCIRFKKPNEIPFDLITELMSKISVDNWISFYEENYKKKK